MVVERILGKFRFFPKAAWLVVAGRWLLYHGMLEVEKIKGNWGKGEGEGAGLLDVLPCGGKL